MVSKKKKKYSTGEGAQFMTRKAALKKLQLSLKDFRRICILKGIYPREPRNRKRAQKGVGGIKTLYHTKDIKFLLHEPIIWKLREMKVSISTKDSSCKGYERIQVHEKIRDYPEINIDHIVKERYPTFVDALRDLDDCLTLCFLFSTFPSLKKVPRDQSMLCRRLTVDIGIDTSLTGRQAIAHYYCTCLNGRRTVGCCSHVMCIVWYMGNARHLPVIKNSC